MGDASSEKDPSQKDKIEEDSITDPIEQLADNLSDILDSAVDDSDEDDQAKVPSVPPPNLPGGAVPSASQPKRQLSRSLTND